MSAETDAPMDSDSSEQTPAVPESDGLQMQKQLHQSRLEANVYNYEEHVSLINVLRQLDATDELFAAWERMAGIFPLSEGTLTAFHVLKVEPSGFMVVTSKFSDLWVAWLEDATKGKGDDSTQYVVQLFERAVVDYLCKFPVLLPSLPRFMTRSCLCKPSVPLRYDHLRKSPVLSCDLVLSLR
jgi:hypothetical protein